MTARIVVRTIMVVSIILRTGIGELIRSTKERQPMSQRRENIMMIGSIRRRDMLTTNMKSTPRTGIMRISTLKTDILRISTLRTGIMRISIVIMGVVGMSLGETNHTI
jgi:hypothetical protein